MKNMLLLLLGTIVFLGQSAQADTLFLMEDVEAIGHHIQGDYIQQPAYPQNTYCGLSLPDDYTTT